MTPIAEHPGFRQLRIDLGALVGNLCRPWKGRLYRCVELKWARTEYLISGEGSLRYGSRWMRPGIQRVVYGSSTEMIALKEARRGLTYYGIKKPRQNPRVTVEILASFSKLISLTDLVAAVSWLEIDDLLKEDWKKVNHLGYETLSQACGRALFEIGCECLAAPSAVDGRGRNRIWFPENVAPDSSVEISGQKDLEKWLAK